MPTTLSPLRYPGGKTVYADMIAEIIQLNNLQGRTFVEAFAGGAGAALTLLLCGNVQKIILNDLDFAIYSFWYSILNETDGFLRLLRETPISIDEWRRQRSIYRNERDNQLHLGFATFYLNRSNRAGILAANPIGGLPQSGKYKINARFNPQKLEYKIQTIANRKESITIYNQDATKFLGILNQEYHSDDLFIYLDPPYYTKGKQLYLNHYREEDHFKLSNEIMSCSFPWVLSYDNAPKIIKLFSNIPTYTKDLSYSIGPPSKTKELVISNLLMPRYLELVENVWR